MALDGCYSCTVESSGELPPWQRIVVTDHWRVTHAFDTSLPGWLVAAPRPHTLSLAELGPEAAAELGPLLTDLSRALEQVTGCRKTYFMQFSEAEGYAHLHIHVVPRMADQPETERGARVFARLGVPEAEQVPEADRDRLAGQMREVLPATIGEFVQ
jgi:diadenosine tetraphosphate (Ap4A) HIT family hydrolase